MQLVEQEQPPETPLANDDDTSSDAAEQDIDKNIMPPVSGTFSPRYSQFLTAE